MGFKFLILQTFLSSFCQAYTFEGINDFRNHILFDKKEISGDFRGGNRWDEFPCDSYYQYHVQLAGKINDVKLDTDDEGNLDVLVEIKNIRGDLYGKYRSRYTACLPVSENLKFKVATMTVDSRVTFIDGEDETASPEMNITIQSTHFEEVDVEEPKIFSWFDGLVTKILNQASKKIWSTSLGEWISEWVTRTLKDKIPTG